MKQKKPRSRKEMAAYLSGHFRYDTMNSWNLSSSYARNIKLTKIELPQDAVSTAWELLCLDNYLTITGFSEPLDQFQRSQNHTWQWGVNGRQGGYIVLYKGYAEPSQYKSWCSLCGQNNYAKVEELPQEDDPEGQLRAYVIQHNHWIPTVYPGQDDVKALGLSDERVIQIVEDLRKEWGKDKPNVTYHNKCGRCGEYSRVNFDKAPIQIGCWPGKDVDGDETLESFMEWDLDTLRARANLIWDFDKAVDKGIKKFILWCRTHEIKEDEVLVTKTVKVPVKKAV